MNSHSVDEPPAGWGTYADAERLRRWSFEQRTPGQRLQWLVDMLTVAYQSGALKVETPNSTGKLVTIANKRNGCWD